MGDSPCWWEILLCMIPALTVFMLDATIVNVALAKLGSVLGVDVTTVDWAVTAFALTTGIVTPMASFVEMRFTMKRVWVTSLILFTVSSLLCGIAPMFWVLILGRLLQGLSGGLLFPIAISALFSAFPAPAAGMAAIGLMLRQIGEQAAVLAFGDAYHITFFAALAAILLAFLLPGRGAIKVDPSEMVAG